MSMASLTPPEPEFYKFEPTSDSPNNILPVLIYRHAFSASIPIGEVRNMITQNHWIPDSHVEANKTPIFHSHTHEMTVVVRGRCQLLVGGTQFGPPPGVMVVLNPGDAIVYPAGIAHCLVKSENYEFLTFFPEKSHKRDEVDCRAYSPKEMKQYTKNISKVTVPKFDPMHGKEGPLVEIWRLAVVQDNISANWW